MYRLIVLGVFTLLKNLKLQNTNKKQDFCVKISAFFIENILFYIFLDYINFCNIYAQYYCAETADGSEVNSA